MKRYGQVIGIKSEALERYKEYHAEASWPMPVAVNSAMHIRRLRGLDADRLAESKILKHLRV